MKKIFFGRSIIIFTSFFLCLIIAFVMTIMKYKIEYSNNILFAPDMPYETKYTRDVVVEGSCVNIMQINDTHFSYDSNNSNNKTFEFLDEAIAQNDPDIIVLNGDIVWSFFNVSMLSKVAKYFDSKQIPWAFILGNHDHEKGSSAYRLFNSLKDSKYCLSVDGYGNLGYGNYFVNIKNTNGDIIHSLCMLDTHSYSLSDKQAQWYSWSIKAIADKYPSANNTIFQHIIYKEATEITKTNNYVGIINEQINALTKQSDMWERIVSLNKTKWVFTGHDHINDYTATIDGVNLKCCRSSGYSAYGQKDFERGVTKIIIDTSTNTVTATTIFD